MRLATRTTTQHIIHFQLVDTLISQVIAQKWPPWCEICTFVSHFLLAFGASVNILLYCSCDKRFFVVVQKTLKSWFVWPITHKSTGEGREGGGGGEGGEQRSSVQVFN
jgi:hypothetical protein